MTSASADCPPTTTSAPHAHLAIRGNLCTKRTPSCFITLQCSTLKLPYEHSAAGSLSDTQHDLWKCATGPLPSMLPASMLPVNNAATRRSCRPSVICTSSHVLLAFSSCWPHDRTRTTWSEQAQNQAVPTTDSLALPLRAAQGKNDGPSSHRRSRPSNAPAALAHGPCSSLSAVVRQKGALSPPSAPI